MVLRFADDMNSTVPGSPGALVSIAGGERYLRAWHEVAKPTWLGYASRHGIDVILIRFPLDRSARAGARSIAWQKCLVPSQSWARQYERLCWIDADILINPDAPSIFAETPPDRIGATGVHDQLSAAERHVLLERVHNRRFSAEEVAPAWATTQVGLYEAAGIATDLVDMVQTGVLVFSPGRDEPLFASSYRRERDTVAYEQPSLSYEIRQSGRMHRLSARWNWGLYDAIVVHHQHLLQPGDRISGQVSDFAAIAGRELQNAYFLHFYRLFTVFEALRPTVMSGV